MNARIGETSVTPFTNPRGSHGFRLRSCSVTGVGACLPERVLTNAELEKKLGKADGWILTRTGIRERRLAADNEFTSDLAKRAAEHALRRANLRGDQIDLIIVATSTPDMMFPATACLVQAKLGA